MKDLKYIKRFNESDKNLNFKNEEISSDTFKSAINVSRERDLNKRTEKLGKMYFHNFIGKPIFEDGIIKDIAISAYKSDSRRLVVIDVEYSNKNLGDYPIQVGKPGNIWVNYDIDNDVYLDIDFPINRTDARLLGKIAEKINPNTKYRETGKFFNIEGW